MKKVFTTFCALLCLVVVANEVKAQTTPINYYVCNDREFKLTPAGGSALSTLYWVVDGVANTLQGSDNGGVLTGKFSDAVTAPKLHKIKLSVLEAVGGCISNVVEYNIIVLPQVTVALNLEADLNLCKSEEINVELSATVTNITGLDEFGVTLAPISWKKGSETLSENIVDGVLTVKAEGEYEAVTSYILPAAGHAYAATSSLLSTAVKTAKRKIERLKDLPGIPVLTLGE